MKITKEQIEIQRVNHSTGMIANQAILKGKLVYEITTSDKVTDDELRSLAYNYLLFKQSKDKNDSDK